MPVTITRKEAVETVKTTKDYKDSEGGEYLGTNLTQIPYIWYLITFQNKSVLVLFDLNREVNIIYPIFAQELGLPIRITDIRV